MSKIETGGPAFPAQHFDMVDGEHGISIRDYFAAKALSSSLLQDDYNKYTCEEHAKYCYKISDAMLEARK